MVVLTNRLTFKFTQKIDGDGDEQPEPENYLLDTGLTKTD